MALEEEIAWGVYEQRALASDCYVWSSLLWFMRAAAGRGRNARNGWIMKACSSVVGFCAAAAAADGM